MGVGGEPTMMVVNANTWQGGSLYSQYCKALHPKFSLLFIIPSIVGLVKGKNIIIIHGTIFHRNRIAPPRSASSQRAIPPPPPPPPPNLALLDKVFFAADYLSLGWFL